MKLWAIDLDSLEMRRIGQWPSSIKGIIYCFIVGSICFLGYKMDIEHQCKHYTTLNQLKKMNQKKFEKTYEYIANLDLYRQQLIELRKTLSDLSQQLPLTNEDPLVLEAISEQASLQGMRVVGVKPRLILQQTHYIEHPLELTLLGSYHGFGQFASQIAQLSRIMTLHDFSIIRHTGTEALEITVLAKTYTAQQNKNESNHFDLHAH